MFIKLNIFAQHQQKASGAVMGMRTGEQQEAVREGGRTSSSLTSARRQPSPLRSRDAHLRFIFNTEGGEVRGLYSDVCGAVRNMAAHTEQAVVQLSGRDLYESLPGRSGEWAADQNSADSF